MKRSSVSPPLVVLVVAIIIVACAAADVKVPTPGLFLLMAVAWASSAGGVAAGMLGTAFAAAALLISETLNPLASATPFAAAGEIAYTLSFVVITFIIGEVRQKMDAAEQKEVQLRSQAAAAEEKLANVLESVTDGILTLDSAWRFTYVNRRGEQILGAPREKLLGVYILDAFPEGTGSMIHREMDRARREQVTVEFESFYAPANRWFEVRGYPAADGSVTAYFRDVTKRKRAQEALAMQARMLDTVKQPVIGIDPDGSIFYWNRAAEVLFAWRADQVVGRATIAIMEPNMAAKETSVRLRRLAKGESWAGQMVMSRRDGTTFPAMVYDTPITGEKGVVLGMVRVVGDLSERLADQRAQQFLADVGSELASTLDANSLVSAVVALAVPALADCCILDILEQGNSSRRIETAWAAPYSKGADARTSLRTYDPELPAQSLLANGETALITRISDQALRAVTSQPTELDRLRRAGVRSLIVAPLPAGGRSLGTMTLVSMHKVYGEADRILATEFARRVALATDNTLLYETARLANQAKSDFLAVMSHELRTPLTTVMGYTDLLLAEVSGGLPATQRTYVDRIRAAAWHLLGLIEQILIYTRVEVGRETLHIERVPIDFVLRDAAALIEPVAAEKGLAFEIVSPGESVWVQTDMPKVRQILLNLLSNAVKFTDRGSVTIEGRVTSSQVEFEIRDTGIGIAPEHLERIFDSFWQVDQSSTRRVGGTGLGLSVARRLARMLGGEVSAESREGVGSRFTLRLPLDSPAIRA